MLISKASKPVNHHYLRKPSMQDCYKGKERFNDKRKSFTNKRY